MARHRKLQPVTLFQSQYLIAFMDYTPEEISGMSMIKAMMIIADDIEERKKRIRQEKRNKAEKLS